MATTPHPRSPPGAPNDHSVEPSTSSTEVLDLLDDEYARSILAALTEGAKPARELVNTCDGSRPTVYRRLDRLESAGLVDSRTALHPDGHHRKEFSTAVDRITLDLTDGEFVAAVDTASPSA